MSQSWAIILGNGEQLGVYTFTREELKILFPDCVIIGARVFLA
jgi:hypothetical protein